MRLRYFLIALFLIVLSLPSLLILNAQTTRTWIAEPLGIAFDYPADWFIAGQYYEDQSAQILIGTSKPNIDAALEGKNAGSGASFQVVFEGKAAQHMTVEEFYSDAERF